MTKTSDNYSQNRAEANGDNELSADKLNVVVGGWFAGWGDTPAPKSGGGVRDFSFPKTVDAGSPMIFG